MRVEWSLLHFSVCYSVVTGIPAIIVGYLGLHAGGKRRAATNKGMSIAGIVMGGLSIVFMIFAIVTGQFAELINTIQSS